MHPQTVWFSVFEPLSQALNSISSGQKLGVTLANFTAELSHDLSKEYSETGEAK